MSAIECDSDLEPRVALAIHHYMLGLVGRPFPVELDVAADLIARGIAQAVESAGFRLRQNWALRVWVRRPGYVDVRVEDATGCQYAAAVNEAWSRAEELAN